MKKIIAAAAGLVLALTACATATPYQPLTTKGSTTGGYAEAKLNDDRYRISFSGNSLTSRETVERYLLFRSAEVTLAQGYDWFALANRHTERKSSIWYSNDPWGYGYWSPAWRYWGGGPYWGGPYWGGGWGGGSGYADRIDKYEASAEIMLGKGARPSDNPAAFDAHQVVANLGPVVVKPPAT
jgi:hypothetical protein